MSYESAPSTKMLATHCVACGRPLRDAKSVELGIGPICRSKYGFDVTIPNREVANRLIYEAACHAQRDDIPAVFHRADQIESLGLPKLAGIIRLRFCSIRIEDEVIDGVRHAVLTTPYCPDFVHAFHRHVPNRGQTDSGEEVKVKRKLYEGTNQHGRPKFKAWAIRRGWAAGLMEALKAGFPGRWAVGPKGTFQIPAA